MATYTTNKNLEKPAASELYNINVANKNNDIIDSELHKLELKYQSQNELFAAKKALQAETERAAEAEDTINASLQNHISDNTNPHHVTKVQLGLGNVNNTSDMDKPVSTAQWEAIDAALSDHNDSESSHGDMRLLISGLTTRLNALADSDDTTLDQMSEIVAYIKNNKGLIDGITTNKINVSDVIDNLTSPLTDKPLSSNQGMILKGLITDLTTIAENKVDKISGKGLSANDYTSSEKEKLAGIATGAQPNVQPDWNVTDITSDAFIKNKPTIPTNQMFMDFLRENGLFDLDGKGRPLLPGYEIVSKDVIVNFSSGRSYTTETYTELFAIEDEKDIVYIGVFEPTQKPGIFIDALGTASDGSKRIEMRNANGYSLNNVQIRLMCIYKKPVPYEPGLKTVSLTKTTTFGSGQTAEFANLEEFGVSDPSMVASVSITKTVNYCYGLIRTDIGNKVVLYCTTGGNKTFPVTVTLIVKDYSNIGPSIVTEGIRAITKKITFTWTGANNSNRIPFATLFPDADFSKEDIIGVCANGLGIAAIPTLDTAGNLVFVHYEKANATYTSNITFFIKVPIIKPKLKSFVKDVTVTLNGIEGVDTGVSLDGSEEVGGYNLTNLHNYTVSVMTYGKWIFPPTLNANGHIIIAGVDAGQKGACTLRIHIE